MVLKAPSSPALLPGIACRASCRLFNPILASPSHISDNHFSDSKSIAKHGSNCNFLIVSMLCSLGSTTAPFSSATARLNISSIASGGIFSSTITRQRLNSAEFSENDGFSVVAPIKVIDPLSTCGRKMSCCSLLNRCISSIKRIVFRLNFSSFLATLTTSLTSLTPDMVAESLTNLRFCVALQRLAIIWANVV